MGPAGGSLLGTLLSFTLGWDQPGHPSTQQALDSVGGGREHTGMPLMPRNPKIVLPQPQLAEEVHL